MLVPLIDILGVISKRCATDSIEKVLINEYGSNVVSVPRYAVQMTLIMGRYQKNVVPKTHLICLTHLMF